MNNPKHELLTPNNCTLIMIDHQPQMTFGVANIDRQLLKNNVVGLAKAASVFNVPTILTAVETESFSGYLWPEILDRVFDVTPDLSATSRPLGEAHPEYACIGGLYFTKGPGGVAQIWGDPRDPVNNFRPQPPRPGELVECCGTGMGFNLWRLDMFRDPDLRKPWFKTQTEGGVATQDLYFWADARKQGYRCGVDCSIQVGHYDYEGKFGPPDTTW